MAINTSAAGNSSYALTGKDGALYDNDGTMLATVDTFTANVNVTNAKYSALGDAQEHETFASYAVTLGMSQIIIQDDEFIKQFIKGMKAGVMPCWNFQGVLKGRNGKEERIVYYNCIPSGQVGLQNVTTGDVIKRNWSFFVNTPPELIKELDIL